MTPDQRQARRDRISSIRDARDAAPQGSAFLADMIGSFVESGRDAWIHRDGVLLGHAACPHMNVRAGTARIGPLSIDLSSPIEELGPTAFRHAGSIFHLNAPDHEGNGEWGLERLAELRKDWVADGVTILATLGDGPSTRIDPDSIVLGPVPCGYFEVHGVGIPALGCSIPFCDLGTAGVVETDRMVRAFPSHSPALALRPMRD